MMKGEREGGREGSWVEEREEGGRGWRKGGIKTPVHADTPTHTSKVLFAVLT